MSEAAIEIRYEAEHTASLFHACDDRVRGVIGPVGSGKSVMCVLEIIMRSLAQAPHNGVRRTRWGVIRNTYPELKTTTLKTWQDWVPPNVATIKWDQPITAKMVQDLPDGTKIDMEVLFVSVDRPADVKKLLSLELTGAWINEAREISKSTLDQLTARIARFPSKREGGATWSGIIMDTNPPDTDHWWYKTFEVERPPGYTIFHQPPALIRVDNGYRANPEAENACNHSRGHYYWLDLIAGKTEEWIKVYVLGQYGTSSDGKPVYPEWVDSIHTAPDILLPWRGLPLIMGWDCSGLRPAVVFGQVTARGQLRIIDELLAIDMGIKQFAADIVKPHLANKYPSMTLISVGDPAGKAKSPTNEATIYDELRKAGLDTMPASTNLFVPRREAVAGFLTRIIDGEPGFLLSPNCENLRQGFNGKYYYKRIQVTGEERWKDEPADNEWTHCFAGDTPVLTPTGYRRIDALDIGDLVETPAGPLAITATMSRPTTDMMHLDLSTGDRIVCTPDHPFWTERGKIRACNLQYSDVLLSVNRKDSRTWRELENMSRRYFLDEHSALCQEGITRSTTTKAAPTCIASCGSITMVQSPRATTFTTRMGTRVTTISPISKSLRGQRISPCTDWLTQKPIQKSTEDTSEKLCSRSQQSGTAARLVASGTPQTPRNFGNDSKRKRSPAHGAKRSTKPSECPASEASALCRVRTWPGRHPASTTNSARAKCVGKCSPPTNTRRSEAALRIVGKRSFQRATRVYDLTVDEAHCFYAGPALVSNCADALQYCCLHVSGDREMKGRTHRREVRKVTRGKPVFFR